MRTIPQRWGVGCVDAPRLPFLALPGHSLQLSDPVAVADQLASVLPVLSCDTVERQNRSQPFRCHLAGLRLGPLSLVALWGNGLRGEVDGTREASFILPYRGSGRFRVEGRSLANVAGQTILYLPPAPWRTSNDAMGGITVRLDPALLRHVGQSMAGPQVRAEHWRTLGSQPLMLQSDQPGLASRFAPMYRLMELINQLMLRHGRLHDVLRLDDLLLRQIVAILCPALLAEPEMPEAEPCVQIIDGLLDWLHANFDQPISLSELETRAHYSRRSLQYAFRKRFGCGPMQYLRRLRLWRARQRIMAGLEILSVSDLAHGCGYLSPASFRRDFRSCFGIPPSQLLAQHRPVGLAMAASRSPQPG